jgi:hypothetical protein
MSENFTEAALKKCVKQQWIKKVVCLQDDNKFGTAVAL